MNANQIKGRCDGADDVQKIRRRLLPSWLLCSSLLYVTVSVRWVFSEA